MKKVWDWTFGLWNKLNTHAKWIVAIVVAVAVYQWWIA